MTPAGLTIADWFTPIDEAQLRYYDIDLGSAGPVLLPDQPGAHPHQLIGGGKVLMISNLVYLQGLSSFNFPFAAVLSLVALVLALGSLALMRPATRRLEAKVAIH